MLLSDKCFTAASVFMVSFKTLLAGHLYVEDTMNNITNCKLQEMQFVSEFVELC